jgi:hypothetical protein
MDPIGKTFAHPPIVKPIVNLPVAASRQPIQLATRRRQAARTITVLKGKAVTRVTRLATAPLTPAVVEARRSYSLAGTATQDAPIRKFDRVA